MKRTKTERVSGLSFEVADIEIDNDTRELAYLQEIREDARRHGLSYGSVESRREYCQQMRLHKLRREGSELENIKMRRAFEKTQKEGHAWAKARLADAQKSFDREVEYLREERAALREARKRLAAARLLIAAYDETLKALGPAEAADGESC